MQYKILIVDDDRELLKMLNQYFTLKNYTVMIAENGIEAMEKISANPDIILLDVNMPGMDGIEVCRRIRDRVSCPIIFLTAKVEEQDRVMGLLSGGDIWMKKWKIRHFLFIIQENLPILQGCLCSFLQQLC